MNSTEASRAIGGYIVNINLPDWKSNRGQSPTDQFLEAERKQKRQNLVAFSILAILVIGIFYIKTKK